MADKRISQLVDRGTVANNDVVPIVVSGASTTNKATISSIQTFMQGNLDLGVTSVGLSMPSAFTVTGSPVTSSGNISVVGAGTVSQYIRGDGSLADFPQGGGGGGSSVNYYLNGSVSQGTIGGVAYLEMNKTPILGAGTDFTINADGYIASFITDAGDPALLEIPAGNWNFETYLQASSAGGTPSFYIELYKVNSGGTATLIASNSATPELIAFGTSTTPYFSALAVPTTTLALTDRLALRYYVTHSGRTITLHTENNTLCQIITTFTTGLTALNGLTAQVQNFATGTSGTDFGISSTSATHTFNLPTASSSNRGALSSADWSTFNGKQNALNGTGFVKISGTTISYDNSTYLTTGTAASTYVPYTGAGANVDLGVYNLTSSAVNVNGSGSNAGVINLESNAIFPLVNGYGTIGSGTTNQFNFYQTTGAGVFRGAILSLNSIPDSVTRTYTLPNADGTLALTTDLGAYLPLTGGTLSNTLFGTTSIFGSAFASNQTSKIGIGFESGYGKINSWGADTSTYGGLSFEISKSNGDTYQALRINPDGTLYASAGGYYGLIDAAFLKVGGATAFSQVLTPPVAKFVNSANNFVKIALGQGETNPNFNDYYGIIALDNSTTLANNKLRFYLGYDDAATPGHSNDQLVIQGDGNVGIGTSSPSVASGLGLVLNGGSGQTRLAFKNTFTGDSSGDGVQFALINGSSGFVFQNRESDGYFSFETNGTERLNIASTGAVTLTGALNGTSATFAGRLSATGSDFHTLAGISASAQLKLERTTTSAGVMYIGADVDGFKVFNSSFATNLLIAPTGAATFSSTISATGTIRTDGASNGLLLRNGFTAEIVNPNTNTRDIQFNQDTNATVMFKGNGNVGIGTDSPNIGGYGSGNTVLSLASTSSDKFSILELVGNRGSGGNQNANIDFINNNGTATVTSRITALNGASVLDGELTFSTRTSAGSLTERMRITSGGQISSTATLADWSHVISNQNASSPNGLIIQYTGANKNNSSNPFLYFTDNFGTSLRFVVYSNGNVENQNNSYGAISDIKLKENIEDATPKLDDLMKVKVRNYNLIGDDKKQIGVIAQELEEVFPAMIDESPDYEEVEVPQVDEEGNEILNEEGEVQTTKERVSKGTTTKSVKYSVFVPMLIKAIQELKTEIDSLKNQIK